MPSHQPANRLNVRRANYVKGLPALPWSAMNVLTDIADLADLPGPLHLAIGVFDGVHCGHQSVIRAAQQAGSSHPQGGQVVVVTFDPHPIRVLSPDRAPRLLTSHRHKMALMAAYGIEAVLVIQFNEEFCRWSGEEFVESLHRAAAPLRTVCVGSDWTFGHQRSGNIDLLRTMGAALDFAVVAVPTVKVGGTTASSTAIREAVARGDFQIAAAMLGRPYTVLGTVVEGRRLGRKIGFPTANLRVHNEQLPPSGVYAVTVAVDSDSTNGRGQIGGVANLGKRPTVEKGGAVRRQLEVHLFDFDADIYAEDIEIRFVRFLREERQFDGIDALKAQISRDADAARAAIQRLSQ